jgi:hypothetical protein
MLANDLSAQINFAQQSQAQRVVAKEFIVHKSR